MYLFPSYFIQQTLAKNKTKTVNRKKIKKLCQLYWLLGIHSYTHTFSHIITDIHTQKITHTHKLIHIYIHRGNYMCMDVLLHTHKHTHTHRHTDTHIYIYIYIERERERWGKWYCCQWISQICSRNSPLQFSYAQVPPSLSLSLSHSLSYTHIETSDMTYWLTCWTVTFYYVSSNFWTYTQSKSYEATYEPSF